MGAYIKYVGRGVCVLLILAGGFHGGCKGTPRDTVGETQKGSQGSREMFKRQVENRLDELKKEIKALPSSAKIRSREMIDKLERQEREARGQLRGLEKESREDWEKAQAKLKQAMAQMEKDLKNLKK